MKILSGTASAILLLTVSLAHGGALWVSNSKGFDTNHVVDRNGTLLADSDPVMVVVGTFASEPATAIPGATQILDSGAYAALLAEFSSYGSPVGLLDQAGGADRRGSFVFQDDQGVAGTALAGKPVYVLIAKGGNLAGAGEVAVIKTDALFEAGDDASPLPKLVGVGTGLGSTVIVGSDALFTNGPSGNDPSAQAAYSLAAIQPAPEIAVEHPPGTDLADGSGTVDFGAVGWGGSSQRTITIRNTGSADLSLTGAPLVTIDGAAAAEFTVTADPATPVGPAGSTTFTVTFTPGAVGVRNAQLQIASDDGDENPFDLDLTGTGVGTAPTDLTLSPDAVAENLASGALVGSLSATDADAGDSFAYTLVAGTGDVDNGLFTIDGDTLKTAAVIDHEAQASASVRVRVADAFGLEYEKALTVTITDDRGEDADMDGLTEAEEEDVHGTSDTDEDSDGDGWADWLEVRLGTEPDVTGPGMDFVVQPNGSDDPTVRVGPGGTLLGFCVERSTTLDGTWVEVADFPAGLPIGQTLDWIDTNAPAGNAFYRVGAYPLPDPE